MATVPISAVAPAGKTIRPVFWKVPLRQSRVPVTQRLPPATMLRSNNIESTTRPAAPMVCVIVSGRR